MSIRQTEEATHLLREAIEQLENPKGHVASAIRKILRASTLVKDESLATWCRIQLGDLILNSALTQVTESLKANDKGEKLITDEAVEKLSAAGIHFGKDISIEEMNFKINKDGGGWQSIETIQAIRDKFSKEKRGNDGTYYVYNLNSTLNFVTREAHSRAMALYHRLEYVDSASTVFDVLKIAVDDKLLLLSPELGEKLMLAFQNASSASEKEKWSQALTSCRRLFEKLADKLYPPRDTEINGRKLGEKQYINRLWAFMDENIASASNKVLAKAHVDLVGATLQQTYGSTNKGVHAEVTRLEAIRIVLHTYLVIGDILSYLDASTLSGGPLLPNIHTASRDEICRLSGLKLEVVSEIIKLRVDKRQVKLNDLAKIKGIGPKAIDRIKRNFSLDVPTA